MSTLVENLTLTPKKLKSPKIIGVAGYQTPNHPAVLQDFSFYLELKKQKPPEEVPHCPSPYLVPRRFHLREEYVKMLPFVKSHLDKVYGPLSSKTRIMAFYNIRQELKIKANRGKHYIIKRQLNKPIRMWWVHDGYYHQDYALIRFDYFKMKEEGAFLLSHFLHIMPDHLRQRALNTMATNYLLSNKV